MTHSKIDFTRVNIRSTKEKKAQLESTMEEKLEARTVTDSPSDDEGGEIGSVLGIMVDKHEAIEVSCVSEKHTLSKI